MLVAVSEATVDEEDVGFGVGVLSEVLRCLAGDGDGDGGGGGEEDDKDDKDDEDDNDRILLDSLRGLGR